jgi:hypothetical protein
MYTYIVLGAGKQGLAIAYDLGKFKDKFIELFKNKTYENAKNVYGENFEQIIGTFKKSLSDD